MALWTPYEPDQALDLSTKNKIYQQLPSPISDYSGSDVRSPPNLPFSYFAYPTEYHGMLPSPPHTVPFYTIPPLTSPSDLLDRSKKLSPRPFKAVSAVLSDCKVAESDPNYLAYRATLLDAMKAKNGGSLTISNPRMKRSVRRAFEAEGDNPDYLEKRQRNNAAAKKSRDLRRQKEDELAIRAAYLERANAELRAKIIASSMCSNCRT